VQDSFGFELFLAQTGQHPPSAKLLKGLGGGAVELIDEKSKQGSKTPQSDIDLIKRRLKDAEADHAARTKQESNK
jgi:phage-related protein